MGACFSSESDYSPSAIVISPTRELRLYPIPVTVSQVLISQALSPDSFFLCNSDRLYFDNYIPSMEPQEELEPAQIYFLMPTAELQRRLAASDLAALAVKASVALNATNPRRNRKSRISPVLAGVEDPQSSHKIGSSVANYCVDSSKNGSKAPAMRISRLDSMRKVQRHSSSRAKLAVRSFRHRLTTINEGSVLLN